MRRVSLFSFLIISILLVAVCSIGRAKAPFIPVNEVHPTHSQFEFNLILNQNRNIPVVLMQFSRDKTKQYAESVTAQAFAIEKDISFALLIDCRNFTYDMNNSLGICVGYKEYSQKDHEEQQWDKEGEQSLNDDQFLRVEFFSPNKMRIKQKGHLLARNHDTQDLRRLSTLFNAEFLAKVIKNEVPDFISYIEDQSDLDEFLKLNSNFRTSKGPKLLYFDQNLQSSLLLRKLAVNLDGWMVIGVTDNSKILSKYGAKFDDLILLEYDFEAKNYDSTFIPFSQDTSLKSLLQNQLIKSYTDIKKPRDILLDFEHYKEKVYAISQIKLINQLISHGRLILIQISTQDTKYRCDNLKEEAAKYGTLFNYGCLKKNQSSKLSTILGRDVNGLLILDESLKSARDIMPGANLYEYLPKLAARQQISSSSEADLCYKTAETSEKELIFFYFNEKTHQNSLSLLKYFNSLPEVTSLLHFCQFYLPDNQVSETYHLNENTIFTLSNPDRRAGNIQKMEHKKVEDFNAIKMFLRQVSISRVIKIYEQKLIKNQLQEITHPQMLTDRCFRKRCVIGLLESDKFHHETQIQILQQLKIAMAGEENLSFYWIDGLCHYEVAKQLKLIPKEQKLINQSYLFVYNQKNTEYSQFVNKNTNKFWMRKDVGRWVKSIREGKLGRLKFSIDLDDKVCKREKQTKGKDDKSVKTDKRRAKKTVSADEL